MAKETFGQMLLNTKDEHLRQGKVEYGELINELGKSYMKVLEETKEQHKWLNKPYYIQIFRPYMEVGGERAFKIVAAARLSLPLIEDNTDLYLIENDKTKLIWSVPHWSTFDKILNFRDGYHPNVIKWILQCCKRYENDVKAAEQRGYKPKPKLITPS